MKRLVWFVVLFFILQNNGIAINYLIITPSQFYDAVLPLVEWEHNKGLVTKIVVIQTGLSAPSIKDTIRNYQPQYVLLVGDKNYIPYGKYFPNWSLYHPPGRGTWTDQFYTDTTDDDEYKDDIYLGRLPGTLASQCSTMVNKILAYEQGRFKNSNWIAKATGIARDSLESNPIYDSCYRTAIRQIAGFRGSTHSVSDNWNSPFGASPQLINNDSMPTIVISPTCRTMFIPETLPSYPEPTIAAGNRWLRHGTVNNLRGAVAFLGTTTHYCANFPDQQTNWRNAASIKFFQTTTNDSEYILGNAIRKAKDSALVCCSLTTFGYTRHATACSVAYIEWNLLGDPALNLWTQIPKTLTITCDTIIPTGPQIYSVTIQEQRNPVENALACLNKDTTIYQTEYSNTTKLVDFSINPADSKGLTKKLIIN